MFSPLLEALRLQNVPVGLNEWLAFLDAVKRGLAVDLPGLYRLGRALLVHSEAHYDAWDIAWSATWGGTEVPVELREALAEWLADPRMFDEGRPMGMHGFESLEALMEAFQKTLEEQKERHEGGNRWVGTGGTSPWGQGGRANMGVALGKGGGTRTGIRLRDQGLWQNYRRDQTLDLRDLKTALRSLRKLVREGVEEFDIEETIAQTARQGGEIEICTRPERVNRVRLVLLMDAGGSMAPHHQLVSRLFSAASTSKWFKSFDHYFFHNCVYGWLHRDYETYDRVETTEVLANLRRDHRVIFVGDASMAPWELFSGAGDWSGPGLSGIDWLRRFRTKCPASIWLNPDSERYWRHPTVTAIGQTFRMFPLTLDGLNDGIRVLRAPV